MLLAPQASRALLELLALLAPLGLWQRVRLAPLASQALLVLWQRVQLVPLVPLA